MTRISATDARRKLYRLIDELSESHEPLHISGKRRGAVMIAEEDWRSIQETLYLLSVPGMRESIMKGLRMPVGKCARTLRW